MRVRFFFLHQRGRGINGKVAPVEVGHQPGKKAGHRRVANGVSFDTYPHTRHWLVSVRLHTVPRRTQGRAGTAGSGEQALLGFDSRGALLKAAAEEGGSF